MKSTLSKTHLAYFHGKTLFEKGYMLGQLDRVNNIWGARRPDEEIKYRSNVPMESSLSKTCVA